MRAESLAPTPTTSQPTQHEYLRAEFLDADAALAAAIELHKAFLDGDPEEIRKHFFIFSGIHHEALASRDPLVRRTSAGRQLAAEKLIAIAGGRKQSPSFRAHDYASAVIRCISPERFGTVNRQPLEKSMSQAISNRERIRADLKSIDIPDYETAVNAMEVECCQATQTNGGLDRSDVSMTDVPPWVREVKEWAADNLKGNQRKVVELIADSAGEGCPLADVAVQLDWVHPWDDNWNSTRKAVNCKAETAEPAFRLFRYDNRGHLALIGQDRTKMS